MKSLGTHLKTWRISGLSRLLPLLAAVMLMAAPMYAAPPKWETVKTENSEAKSVVKDTDIEILTARGVIVVTASKPVQVKVYTILGQLVSRETLPAGTSQLTVQAHGVYIIKSGDLTCKVAL
ncbi:MAG: T9SS type A sorting domain-containing protein [Muribaculaceae bacterium]|nr:T9SS type A sorting domain-containing protein [Muribaculaceae bacterium]